MRPVPISPSDLPALVAQTAAALPDRRLRVAVDGAPAAGAGALADAVAAALPALGRPAVRIRAADFWRPASVRLEHGRTDVQSFAEMWLDDAALRREVLDPFVADGRYLPALWDVEHDRSARAAVRTAPTSAVLLIDGTLLLDRGLVFDLTVHMRLSTGALRRRTPADEQWTLPAYDGYRGEGFADIVVRADDPAHPAVVVRA